jgi:hypothetical protein
MKKYKVVLYLKSRGLAPKITFLKTILKKEEGKATKCSLSSSFFTITNGSYCSADQVLSLSTIRHKSTSSFLKWHERVRVQATYWRDDDSFRKIDKLVLERGAEYALSLAQS